MIKEVEFSNRLESIAPGYKYSDATGQQMFDGVLSNDGKTLNITVGTPVPDQSEGVRKLFLYYCNIDFDNNLLDYTLLGETDPDYFDGTTARENRTYEFDLSKVLIIPRRVYNNQGTSEITIQLYTYEANITTDYGTKRLSVPYTVSNNSNYEYSESTDGIFKLVMVDFKIWDSGTTYSVGEMVKWSTSIYKSLTDGNQGNNPYSSTSNWGTPTSEEMAEFVYGGYPNPPLNAIVSDVMISRYAKYSYILETLLKTGFKPYDDKYAYELVSYLQTCREGALFSLLNHKPIEAGHKLQQLKLASSTNNVSAKVRSYNITYTI